MVIILEGRKDDQVLPVMMHAAYCSVDMQVQRPKMEQVACELARIQINNAGWVPS